MKRIKLLMSALIIGVILTLTLAPLTSVRADDVGPQGGSNSTRPAPPPPPPPPSGSIIGLLGWWLARII